MPHVSLQAMQVSLGSSKYSQITEPARKSDDHLGSANALADTWTLQSRNVTEAMPAKKV
jgi:hypothetical protein